MRRPTAWFALALLAALPASAATAGVPTDSERAIQQATVTMQPSRCAGVVVGEAGHVLTAAHCLTEGEEERVSFELYDGRTVEGTVTRVDAEQDLAIVRLDHGVDVKPLAVAESLPAPGEPVLFAGRNDRPGDTQLVEVERLAPCPSLPGVPAALFTSLRGEKGDSGAPVVDLDLQVVGLVHGGAAYSIATPTAGFAPVVDAVVDEEKACFPENRAATR
jgi:S1-C subfamily serine protease